MVPEYLYSYIARLNIQTEQQYESVLAYFKLLIYLKMVTCILMDVSPGGMSRLEQEAMDEIHKRKIKLRSFNEQQAHLGLLAWRKLLDNYFVDDKYKKMIRSLELCLREGGAL